MQNIKPCLWFDDQAEEAAKFYCSAFSNSKMGTIARYGEHSAKASGRPEGSVMTATFQIEGFEMVALNGGPIFKINPSISFMVTFKKADEVVALHKKLVDGGSELMPLDTYPWSEKYAWVMDKYGVTWQILTGESEHKIRPALMFCGQNLGRAEEAMKRYTSLFENSKIESVMRFEEGEGGKAGDIKHGTFTLDGQGFVAMDAPGQHDFTFGYGVSLMAYCNAQSEIDKLWKDLTAGGEAQQCGWLSDKFGVEWQVVPASMDEIMKDPARGEKVMEVLLGMKKLEIKELEMAASR